MEKTKLASNESQNNQISFSELSCCVPSVDLFIDEDKWNKGKILGFSFRSLSICSAADYHVHRGFFFLLVS